MDEINSFNKGLKDGLPIAIGYFSVSFAFGIFAVENGLSVMQSVLVSLLNLTSAGQLAGVPIMASGTLGKPPPQPTSKTLAPASN